MSYRLHHPFTCIVTGPTQSGKTHFIQRLLHHATELISPPLEKVIWCYSEWQPFYETLSTSVEFHEGLPTDADLSPPEVRKLFILDDLADETNNTVSQMFTKKSHHWNASVVYVTQNLFSRNKHNRTISINAHYIVCFKNPRDNMSIQFLARQMFCGNSKFMVEAYKDSTEQAHGYLFIDAKQETPEELRLRTNIFPGETHFVYVKRK